MEACHECGNEITSGQSVLLLCDCGYVTCKECCIQLLARSVKAYHLVECPQCKSESDSVRGRDKAYAAEATLVKLLFDTLQVYRKKGSLSLAQVADLTEHDYLEAFRELNKRIDSNQMINKGLRELLKDADDITLNGKSDQEICDMGTLSLKLTLARVQSVILSDKPARKHKFVYGPLEHISFVRNIHLEKLVAVTKERDRLQKRFESQNTIHTVTIKLDDMNGKLNKMLEAIGKQGKYFEALSTPTPHSSSSSSSSSSLLSTTHKKPDKKSNIISKSDGKKTASTRRESTDNAKGHNNDTNDNSCSNKKKSEKWEFHKDEKIKVIDMMHGQQEVEEHMDVCDFCGKGGNLLCCDSCTCAFHLRCLHLTKIPEGEWYCPYCISEYETNAAGSSAKSASLQITKICSVPNCTEKVFSSHHMANLCAQHRKIPRAKRRRDQGLDPLTEQEQAKYSKSDSVQLETEKDLKVEHVKKCTKDGCAADVVNARKHCEFHRLEERRKYMKNYYRIKKEKKDSGETGAFKIVYADKNVADICHDRADENDDVEDSDDCDSIMSISECNEKLEDCDERTDVDNNNDDAEADVPMGNKGREIEESEISKDDVDDSSGSIKDHGDNAHEVMSNAITETTLAASVSMDQENESKEFINLSGDKTINKEETSVVNVEERVPATECFDEVSSVEHCQVAPIT